MTAKARGNGGQPPALSQEEESMLFGHPPSSELSERHQQLLSAAFMEHQKRAQQFGAGGQPGTPPRPEAPPAGGMQVIYAGVVMLVIFGGVGLGILKLVNSDKAAKSKSRAGVKKDNKVKKK